MDQKNIELGKSLIDIGKSLIISAGIFLSFAGIVWSSAIASSSKLIADSLNIIQQNPEMGGALSISINKVVSSQIDLAVILIIVSFIFLVLGGGICIQGYYKIKKA